MRMVLSAFRYGEGRKRRATHPAEVLLQRNRRTRGSFTRSRERLSLALLASSN